MSTYIIGDIQGCYAELALLLKEIDFKTGKDQLIVAGDLINRGPKNVETLKLLQDLPDTRCVLGNHDLHFLAVATGTKQPGKSDTIVDLLESKDLNDHLLWLSQQKLLIDLPEHHSVVVHAGLPHIWSIAEAKQYAAEIESVITTTEATLFYEQMYGNEPARLNGSEDTMTRLRVLTNYLTRMRFCNIEGELELNSKLEVAPVGYAPWFTFPRSDAVRILFGHWAALGGRTNSDQFVGLDTGCVWGERLTALRLEDNQRFSVPAQQAYKPIG